MALLLVVLAVLGAWTEPQPVVITLERTACYGSCPVYSLRITGDGRVEYDGREFVKVVGKQTATISPDAVRDLVAEFERIHYFDLKDKYTADVTDLPTVTTSIRIGARYKRVINYFGAPKELWKLEERIDEVAGSERWVKGSSPGKTTAAEDRASCAAPAPTR